MPLDLHIKYDDELFYFDISESLHSSIFSNSTGWRSFKYLRKIKDYYRADLLFKDNDAVSFLKELVYVCEKNGLASIKINEIKVILKENKIIYLRVSSD
ncbi:hypothetical protein [Pectobacterium sp. B1J-3]|uniref:hypothetical protein n=1 Tax=Pectobacterium sp. B1J-3 TaxID=3385371 RepID=UPI0039057C83